MTARESPNYYIYDVCYHRPSKAVEQAIEQAIRTGKIVLSEATWVKDWKPIVNHQMHKISYGGDEYFVVIHKVTEDYMI